MSKSARFSKIPLIVSALSCGAAESPESLLPETVGGGQVNDNRPSSASSSSGFCVLGALGCPCDGAGSCGAGLACSNGKLCCDPNTGQCSAPTPAAVAGNPGAGSTANPGPRGTAMSSGGCVAGVEGPVLTDCGYPFASSNPRTSVEFNESEVLRGIVPSGGAPLASVRLFYNDEHALTLGVRSVSVTSSSGKGTTEYPVSPLPMSPSSVRSPQTGSNALVGDQSGLDTSGRPMWPALFVTDTTSDSNSTAGDWQQGGTPWNPSAVYGTWKAAVRTVDTTQTPPDVAIAPDADPDPNAWNLGNGDPVPASLLGGTAMGSGMRMEMGMGMRAKVEAFGAEVRWDLVLVSGHSYRIQVMVHDGDQNRVGGDSGEACVNFCASSGCPEGSIACGPGGTCPIETESLCTNGCCI